MICPRCRIPEFYFVTPTVCKTCFDRMDPEERERVRRDPQFEAKGKDFSTLDQNAPILASSDRPESEGFNFGAAFLAPIWLLAHGKVGYGLLLVLYSFLSRIFGVFGLGAYLVGVVITSSIIVYCGSIGNRIAMEYRGLSSIEEAVKTENGWNIAGGLVGIVYTLVVIANLVSFFP
jgi:hypothetical protein